MTIRVRFAPSPTGHVHIGNIRVAIFNWLFARHGDGRFCLRIEDTDRERSTPEAIKTLLDAMAWLELDYDDEAVFQSALRVRHEEAADALVAAGHADRDAPDGPHLLHLHEGLFDSAFVSDPRETTERAVAAGTLHATPRGLLHLATDSGGEVHRTPFAWDAMPELVCILDSGETLPGETLRERALAACAEASAGADGVDAAPLAGGRIATLRFRRRYVFFDDLVLGRREKPLDSLRDFVIVRSDGSPVFHLANVVDDAAMGITHILRGNDHVENTFRHLFLFRALGQELPRYGHFPMVVNEKGKPYSKRDGDAYVGDFRARGILPEALVNFLALCGWGPGDDREKMSRAEMVEAFTLDRVSAAPAQFNQEKLAWMNGLYLTETPVERLLPLIRNELASAGLNPDAVTAEQLLRLVELERERIRTIPEFIGRTRYVFADEVAFDPKAVKKVLLKKDGAGLDVLRRLKDRLAALPAWSEPALDEAVQGFAAGEELPMGQVAQPLRVAVTGGTVSPGIHETLALLGRDRVLRRIERALETIPPDGPPERAS